MKHIFLFSILTLLRFGTTLFAQDTKEINVIAIYGDTKTNHEVHQKIVNNIITYHPQLVVHTGDEVNMGFMKNEWNKFNSITKDLRSTAMYFPVPGNHEFEAPQYYANFDLPEPKKWYSYSNGGLLMLFFNTNVDIDTASQQYKYFVKVLEEKGKSASYIIAIAHHPPYTTAAHQRRTAELQEVFTPLFKKYNVSALFSGHVHAFEHSVVNSMQYVVTGGGGASLHKQKYASSFSKKYYFGFNFCILHIYKDKIQVKVYDENNQPVYDFEILSQITE